MEVNDIIKACMKEMQYAPGEDGSNTVDAEDFSSGFKEMMEKLASSPSGCYGHNKAVHRMTIYVLCVLQWCCFHLNWDTLDNDGESF